MIRIDIEGGVKLNIEIEEREIKTWEPERTARFFAGIAEVIKAINSPGNPEGSRT